VPLDPRTPVLVGVSQLEQRVDDPLEGDEPLLMMFRAVEAAGIDSGSKNLLQQADAVCVIRGRWRYENPAKLVAEHVGADGAQTAITPFGGNMVQSALNRFARDIAAGNRETVILTGAEHGRSQARARKQGLKLKYGEAPGEPDISMGPDLDMVHEAEMARKLVQPVLMYPIFENALRYARGEGLEEHRVRISELWARFNAVAVDNPHAWIRTPMTAEEIRTPSPTNRMVGYPYTKLMNSNDSVDMAAALVMCSVEAAERAGIPRDRWVFLHAGTDAHDHPLVSNRDNLHSSPAIRIAGRRALELAGVEPNNVDHVDLYSCFPSAVQVAALELGFALERPLTVTGGLTFGGGPLNNYVMHSIARMTEVLRANPGQTGLCTANGGFLTKHAFGVYSTEPPETGFQYESCQSGVDALPRREAVVNHDGAATLESYTVRFGPSGPEAGVAAFLLDDGRRTWGVAEDPELARAMTEQEFCGRSAVIDGQGAFTVA
jgi:acetyl-CoA C-acetyltransferase